MEGDTGSATISSNQIAGGISVWGSSLIYNNSIGTSTFDLTENGAILINGGDPCTISDNQLTGQIVGGGSDTLISDNTLSGCGIILSGATIQNNLIMNNANGDGVEFKTMH